MLPKEISKYAIQPIAALNHNMKMLKRLGYVTMCIFIVLLGNDGNIQAKADSPSYVTNVGSIAPPDTMQSGYHLYYTGTGTIKEVDTTLDSLPSVTIPDPGNFVAFLLNTGDLNNCAGFMQVGILAASSNSWVPVFMNGNPSCGANNIPLSLTINQGNKIQFLMAHSTNPTIMAYEVINVSTGYGVAQDESSFPSWSPDSFQTMTEATSLGASLGSTTYDSSVIQDPNGNNINVVSSGNPNLTSPVEDGGACTDAVYAPGAWQNSPTYGYAEPAVSPKGNCLYHYDSAAPIGSGTYSNPTKLIYGPDNVLAQEYGGNSGDGATIAADLGQSFSGTLKIDGYSYNNGRGGYYTHVKVETSSDNINWSLIYSQTWNPSSTNTPSEVTIGSVSNVKYVRITAVDDLGNSANLFVDAVRIGV